jgi:integrase
MALLWAPERRTPTRRALKRVPDAAPYRRSPHWTVKGSLLGGPTAWAVGTIPCRQASRQMLRTVGESKSEAGEGRTIPLNADVLAALVAHSKWYLKKFGETRPECYVSPFGKPQPTDPTRPATSFKTVWAAIKKDAGVTGRWHDNRHTFITDLAESGEASDETIRDMAGHVSKQMLKHYSHIRMEAKRRAVDALLERKPVTEVQGAAFPGELAKEVAKVVVFN